MRLPKPGSPSYFLCFSEKASFCQKTPGGLQRFDCGPLTLPASVFASRGPGWEIGDEDKLGAINRGSFFDAAGQFFRIFLFFPASPRQARRQRTSSAGQPDHLYFRGHANSKPVGAGFRTGGLGA